MSFGQLQHMEITRGNSPVVLGFPHTGTDILDDIWADLNDRGRALADTDWHIHQLYQGLLDGVTSVRTRVHRYVIDVNRDPDGQNLYPGQNTTMLCPTTDFDGKPIYRQGRQPDEMEVHRRCEKFHRPYHAALQGELDRVRKIFGFVILYDCHSIRSEISFLFDGKLPDFNIGTNNGTTCDPQIEALTSDICQAARGYSHVLNGRFKGGWTTRHYGNPAKGVHTIQMELAQSTYVDEHPPWSYQKDKAGRLRTRLENILTNLSNWRPS